MRLIRAGLPAAVAALLWLASGGLELLGRQTLSGPVRHVLSLVARETIPVQELTAPAPFAVISMSLSTIAIFAAYAGLAALVRRQQPGNTATAFAAYWLCGVASGFLVSAIPVAIELVTAVVEQQTPFGLVAERVAGAAQWGLVFGWIPAAVGVALERTDDDELPVYARRLVALPAAVLFVVAAVGISVTSPLAYAAVQAQIPTEPPPVPAPVGTPVPGVAPGDWQIDPLWCTSGQLQITAGIADAALGSRGMRITALNVSDAPCIVEGYPDVAFADEFSSALEVQVDHGGTMLTDDPGVSRIEVQPGSTVVAGIGWGAMATAGQQTAGWLHVAAYSGAERQMAVIETDITAGGTVSVTAWGPPLEPGQQSVE